jgi:hypothetical protein
MNGLYISYGIETWLDTHFLVVCIATKLERIQQQNVNLNGFNNKTTTMAEQMAAILAEPMDEDDPMDAEEGMNDPTEVFSRNWAQLEKQHPRSFLEIVGRPEHYLATGEFVCLRHPVYICAKVGPDGDEVTLQSTVARILTVQSHTETNVDVWLNLLIPAIDFPQFPLSPVQAPPSRTYMQFPPELIWTNLTVRLDAREVLSEAFVFRHRHILFNDAGICVGMENAFFVRLRWQRDPWQWSGIPVPGDFWLWAIPIPRLLFQAFLGGLIEPDEAYFFWNVQVVNSAAVDPEQETSLHKNSVGLPPIPAGATGRSRRKDWCFDYFTFT